MNKVFTYVPQRSYDAFLRVYGSLGLQELLAAFAVDPLAADDAAEDLGVDGVPHSLIDFAYRGHGVYRQALETISQWMSPYRPSVRVHQEASATNGINELYKYDSRLGIWAGLAVARFSLSKLDAQVPSLTKAVDSVADFVVGASSAEEAYAETEPVRRRARRPMERSFYTGVIRCVDSLASMIQGNEDTYPSDLVLYAIEAFDDFGFSTIPRQGITYYKDREAAALQIRTVMAEACLSYPVIP